MPRRVLRFRQRTAKNPHRIATRSKIKQTAGHRRHAEINIAGSNRDRHGLRRLKRHQLRIQPFLGIKAAFLGEKIRRM